MPPARQGLAITARPLPPPSPTPPQPVQSARALTLPRPFRPSARPTLALPILPVACCDDAIPAFVQPNSAWPPRPRLPPARMRAWRLMMMQGWCPNGCYTLYWTRSASPSELALARGRISPAERIHPLPIPPALETSLIHAGLQAAPLLSPRARLRS
ncbi:MAG: hypothetical protein J3K34DRAFT_263525 [Monoraphidium minutum]|nr:MAG: hypothetical protein J3K34DRAFT_263525 [Monoraphidium minutum]